MPTPHGVQFELSSRRPRCTGSVTAVLAVIVSPTTTVEGCSEGSVPCSRERGRNRESSCLPSVCRHASPRSSTTVHPPYSSTKYDVCDSCPYRYSEGAIGSQQHTSVDLLSQPPQQGLFVANNSGRTYSAPRYDDATGGDFRTSPPQDERFGAVPARRFLPEGSAQSQLTLTRQVGGTVMELLVQLCGGDGGAVVVSMMSQAFPAGTV